MGWPLARRALPAALIVLVVLGALPILAYPLGRDQGMYANIGAEILRGGTPYLDMWDIKPPPIYSIYAFAISVFGATPAGVRVIDLVAVPLGMLGLLGVARHLPGADAARGRFAALLYAVFYLSDQFANLTQSDSLVTVPMIWAVWLACRAQAAPAGSRAAWRWALLCGGVCGVVVWFKQYQVFFVAALALHHLWARRSPAVWREALAFSAGALAVGGSIFLLAYASGMWAEMLLVAAGTSAYNAQYAQGSAFLSQIAQYAAFRWQHWGLLLALAALWLARRPAAWRGWGLVWLWLAAGTAFMLAQRLGFDTHWFPMLPPLALLAADTCARAAAWLGKRLPAAGVQAVFMAVFLGILAYNTWLPALPYLMGQQSQAQYFRRFQANDLKPWQSLEVVEWLRPRLVPGDSLYIWGFRPEVAFMGGWRPATRFQAQFPLVAPWYPAAWRQENVDVLWAAMPPYVLVMQDDFMPWTTGVDADSHTILQGYTELNNWLIANYERITTLGDFLIWQRKPPTS
jgi:hypothetical protein